MSTSGYTMALELFCCRAGNCRNVTSGGKLSGYCFRLGMEVLPQHHRTIEVTVQAALAPNALITGMNADLALLFGTTMTSLARIGMSSRRPRMTAATSTGI